MLGRSAFSSSVHFQNLLRVILKGLLRELSLAVGSELLAAASERGSDAAAGFVVHRSGDAAVADALRRGATGRGLDVFALVFVFFVFVLRRFRRCFGRRGVGGKLGRGGLVFSSL